MEHTHTDKIVLGIHYAHDSTVALIKNGKIVEAMSEERLSRLKKYTGFPHKSLEYIKDKYKLTHIDHVVVVGLPEYSFGAIFVSHDDNVNARKHRQHPNYYLRSLGFRFPILGKIIDWRDKRLDKKAMSGKKEQTEEYLKKLFPGVTIEYVHHHLAHAYAALLFVDNHEKQLIVTCDGAGDDLCSSVNVYEHGKMERVAGTPFSASIGLLYAAVTDFMGMSRNEHEFKVMGLAPYAKQSSGEKVYEQLKKLIWLDKETLMFKSNYRMEKIVSYLLAHEYFLHRFDSLAYGIQKLTEELLIGLVDSSIKKYKIGDVAVGGGVFMNVKANQHILALPSVNSLTVIPSCGDESLALGACVYGYNKFYSYKDIQKINDLYLGSEYTDGEIKKAIDDYTFTQPVTVVHYPNVEGVTIEQAAAKLLSENNVVGRFSGRAEWGARALGNRSILANPSSRDNVKLINEMIKNRDFWMPFATSVMEEEASTYLHNEKMKVAPFMAITFETKEKAHKELAAALHPYDLTSRPQVVTKEANPKYHSLIHEFKNLTGIGGVLNTSFNLHGEPNVEAPYDALRTFDLSGMRYLAIGDYLLSK